jgi:hypothetical protein
MIVYEDAREGALAQARRKMGAVAHWRECAAEGKTARLAGFIKPHAAIRHKRNVAKW